MIFNKIKEVNGFSGMIYRKVCKGHDFVSGQFKACGWVSIQATFEHAEKHAKHSKLEFLKGVGDAIGSRARLLKNIVKSLHEEDSKYTQEEELLLVMLGLDPFSNVKNEHVEDFNAEKLLNNYLELLKSIIKKGV
jgi:hypothetical protein